MRCLKCQRDGIALDEKVCPNTECSVVFSSLFRDILPHNTLLHGNMYQIEYALGRGGFGVTYRATHRGLQRMVAIKEYYPQSYAMRTIQHFENRERPDCSLQIQPDKKDIFDVERRRFIHEARVLADLKHPGVVNVFDFFFEFEWETAYMVMELLRGQTLRQRLDQQPERKLPPEQVINITKQLVSALEYLHKNTIHHLDIKPENVFLAKDEQGQERAVLIDFGAARRGARSEYAAQFDQEYAPLEIMIDDGEVGPGSDIYELAMMIYELLTGTHLPNSLQRRFGQDWDVITVEEPWRGLLTEALYLSRARRPTDVRDWWERHMMNPELYTFVRENRAAFPDPEIARETLGQTHLQMSRNQGILQSQMTSMQDQLKSYEQALEQKQQEIAAAEHERSRLQSQLTKKQEEIEAAERERARIQKQLTQKQKDAETAERERSRIQNQLAQKDSELAKQSKELETKEYSIYDKEKHIEELEKKITDLEDYIDEMSQNDEEKSELANKLNHAEEQVEKLTRRRDELKQKLDRVNQKVLLLEEEIENKTIDIIVKELKSGDEAVKSLQKRIAGMGGRMRKLEHELTSEREENVMLQNEIDMLRRELQETRGAQGNGNSAHLTAPKPQEKPSAKPPQSTSNGSARKRSPRR